MATKLGGTETVQRASRVNIQGVRGFGDGGAGELARSINNVVQSAGKVAIKEMRVADAEDRIDMKNHAIDTNIDITNGMMGASKDPVLNASIKEWRSSGNYSETEIRTMAHNYKRNEAMIGFEAEGMDKDFALPFFETLNTLELRDITPLAQKDLSDKRNELKNKISSSFMVGVEPLDIKYKDAEDVVRANGISTQELNSLTITSAFGKAFRTGDTSDIDALETLTNSKGIRIIDTVEGSKLYAQMLDAKHVKDLNDEARLAKEAVKATKAQTQSLYVGLLNEKTIESTKVKMDDDVSIGVITREQHASLTRTYNALLESSDADFRDTSVPKVFSALNADAQLGVLSQDELLNHVSELSSEDFKAISRLASQQGGAFGKANEYNDIMNDAIVDFGNDYAGIDLTASIKSDLEGLKLGQKRQSALEETLRKKKYSFVRTNGRLPDELEFEKMKTDTIKFVDDTVGTLTVTGDVKTQPKSYEEAIRDRPSDAKGKREWIRNLSPENRDTYRASLIKKMNEYKNTPITNNSVNTTVNSGSDEGNSTTNSGLNDSTQIKLSDLTKIGDSHYSKNAGGLIYTTPTYVTDELGDLLPEGYMRKLGKIYKIIGE